MSEFLSLAPSNVKLILCDVSNSAALKVAGKMWASKKVTTCLCCFLFSHF